ncbi:MAG: Gfo/Idh/MocA family oxidoreductase [Flavobacteriaceae bacterium]|nr:Gfo/Idh/MocA family oxidoreductase [Flavobacteriaceae bacterium]MDG1912726.1 Gfo/Idh/MocA family oxidoreductase [Flavobacteriaceae bacterium]
MRTVRWGILGLGSIANKFASDLLLVPNTELIAVASSDYRRAEAFSEKYSSKRFYDSYQSLFDDSDVEIIYIASLHPKHAELSIAALKHRKAVLCEKPLAMNEQEVKAMISASHSTNVFLMEGLWTRFNPSFQQAQDWIKEGKLGRLRYINATFSFNGLDRGPDSRLFHPDKGGGTLLDIGIYPLFLAYQLLGKPKNIQASAHLTAHGVDQQLAILLTYENAHAVLYSSFAHNEVMSATIAGEEGEIYMDSRWHETPKLSLVKGEEMVSEAFDFIGKGYSYEIEEASQCIREGKKESAKWSLDSSLELMQLMDSIRQLCGIHYPSDRNEKK